MRKTDPAERSKRILDRPLAVFPTAAVLLGLLLLAATGCSVRQLAITSLADALSGSGSTFASDDDPELIRQAVPFSLKLIESLLEETPQHRGLLSAACSGFTQYAYAFVQLDADEIEPTSLHAAEQLRDRARKLYLRARDYGLRGLDAAHPGLTERLRAKPRAALARTRRDDVPLLYWLASAWGAAITISKDDPELIADQPVVEALIDRALALDERFQHGAIHAFLVLYEPARPGASPRAAEASARQHFDRAVALSGGRLAAPFVALAESVAIQRQDRAEFERLLNDALRIDVNGMPEARLLNLVTQRRARWLLARAAELFVESTP
ncbi:MAG: hypothetical protein CHACPFDD_00505 [Phycisphaerae bacterium]|nr:hypothetical protein [Phycisphaerae bacterium]